jgi:heme O synthase-like polyprenyltransferase
MAERSALTEFSSTAVQERHWGGSTMLSDYWALTKPEVSFLILITTFVGFYLASACDGRFSFAGLFNTLLGTLLVATGTGSLNQYLERGFDAQMRRTARRPAGTGRLTPSAVLVFGTALSAVGSIWSRDSCQPAHECARNFDVADVSVRLHPTETKNTNVRSRRSLPKFRYTWAA